MDAACDHLAEYRLAGEFRVGMKPLRVIGAGEIKDLLPGNRPFTRFSAFSYLEILKRAVRHDGHKGLFPGHRCGFLQQIRYGPRAAHPARGSNLPGRLSQATGRPACRSSRAQVSGTIPPPGCRARRAASRLPGHDRETRWPRSEEHTSELQSLLRTSYAVFCLKNKTTNTTHYS